MGGNRGTSRLEVLAWWHAEVLEIGELLIRAVAIERDICSRLARQPKNATLLKQRGQYQRLVRHLLWEHRTALANYLGAIRRGVKR